MISLRKKRFDVWYIPVAIVIASYGLFLLYPVFNVIKSSFFNESGSSLTLASYVKFFTVPYYYKALLNTLFLGFFGTVIIMLITMPMAYFYTRSRMFGHVAIGTLIWIPYLTPAFIGAYTWLILFGKFGLITKFLMSIGFENPPTISGLGGILAIFVLSYYPFGFVLLKGAFETIDPSLEESAENLGSSPLRRFWTVTLPAATPSILNASLMVFIIIIDAFGIPAIVGVGVPVLTTLVYGEFTSELGGPPIMAATGSTILLSISMTILIFQRVYLKKRSYYSRGVGRPKMVNPKIGKKILLTSLFLIVLIVSILPIITIIVSAFTKADGPVLRYGTWTLENFRKTMYSVWIPLKTSVTLAFASSILDLILGGLMGYVIVRKGKFLGTFMDAFTSLPMGIPGVLIGIGMVISFSSRPLLMAGTGFIIVAAYFIRRLPHPIRTVSSLLSQINPDVEEASVNLGVPPIKTFYKVTTRMVLPGIITGGLLAWTRSIADLTCTILIFSAKWKTLTIETYSQIRGDQYGAASVLGLFLMITVVTPVLILNVINDRKKRKEMGVE